MNKHDMIEVIEGSSLLSSDKRALVAKVLSGEMGAASDEAKVQIEQYRIDKMIEAGLVKEKTFTEARKDKIIDDVMVILKDARFYYVLISILIFTSVMFNSGHFWEYQTRKLDYNHNSEVNNGD
jgi:hypothetical protein